MKITRKLIVCLAVYLAVYLAEESVVVREMHIAVASGVDGETIFRSGTDHGGIFAKQLTTMEKKNRAVNSPLVS